MVKVIYACDVCGRTYDTFDEAKYCEARKNRQKDYPQGLMFGCHIKDQGMNQYMDITFAVKDIVVCGLNPHNMNLYAYACKNSNNICQDYACSWSDIPKYASAAVMNPNHKTFKRMVMFLQRQGISPTVWDGKKPISLAEHEKLWANKKNPIEDTER